MSHHPSKQVRTLKEKLKIIEEVEKNPSQKRNAIAKNLGLAPSTLNSIVAKKREIREQIDKCGNSYEKRKTGRKSTFSDLETVLFTWYQQALASNIPVNGNILKEKATVIANIMNIKNFSASNGWITRFKKRHGLGYKKQAALDTSAVQDKEMPEQWLERLPRLLEGYEPRDIYNADETGLFYNVLPDGIMTLESDTFQGVKNAKNRITVLLCVNSDGSDKQMPIVVGRLLKPRCFTNIKKLPVKYYANKNSWMTTDIFLMFLRSLDASMGTQGRKILLFVDNCAIHPQDTTFLRNVKVVRYPANCATLSQPLSLGIIKAFKHLYRKRLVQTAICLKDEQKNVNIKIDLMQAIHFVMAAWREVSQLTIVNCFRKGGCESKMSSEVAMDDDAFREDWTRFVPPESAIEFGDYVSVDSELATCAVGNADELDNSNGDRSDEEDESISNTIPSFAEAYAALSKVKTFFYAHNISDRDEDNILNVEKTLFDIKYNVSVKQLSKSLT